MGQKDKYRTCKSCLILPFELDFVGLLNTLPFPHAKVDRTLLLCGLQGSAYSILSSWQLCHHLSFLAKKIQYNKKKFPSKVILTNSVLHLPRFIPQSTCRLYHAV